MTKGHTDALAYLEREGPEVDESAKSESEEESESESDAILAPEPHGSEFAQPAACQFSAWWLVPGVVDRVLF